MTSLKSIVALLVASTAPLHAATIAEDVSGTTSSRFQFFWGQSFTTPAGGPWRDIAVNFYDLTHTPYAAGTGYLFAAVYSGTPAQLSAAGALAVSSVADGSVYRFGPSLRLQSGTQYFFYEDTAMRLLGGGIGDVGGTSVFTQFGTGSFASAGGLNAAFTVAGTAVAVPEPASWAMLVTGFAGLGAVARCRRRADAGRRAFV